MPDEIDRNEPSPSAGEASPTAREHLTEHKHGGLGQLPSTAICGNDITSSCLYVSALAILAAGKWAPLSLLIVAGVLFLFRSIYSEVVGALPLNGGAYNALLNTTSKYRASIAACLTILSYMATAVISANEAMHYAHHLWEGLPVIPATICLLAVFMILSIIGISESAVVAIGIFVLHLATLTLLVLVGLLYLAMHGFDTLSANMHAPTEGSVGRALFFGFAAALLGISGFESSANFVEEQAEGVFPKTLRNMWIAVGIFNPAMALLALSLLPIHGINDANKESLLANMGDLAGGRWLALLISLDAVLVLSGAVLTSFVGVNGLVRRMTLDRCLPQFLLKTNRRHTTHRIIIAFFLLAVSVLLITRGKIEALAGVYTISFLAVMALFCLGNILLKVKRGRLPRPTRAPWPFVLTAFAAVLIGIVGNILARAPAKIFYRSEDGTIAAGAGLMITGPDGEASVVAIAGEPITATAERISQLANFTGVHAEAADGFLTLVTKETGSEAFIKLRVLGGQFETVANKETVRGSDGFTNFIVFLEYFVPALLIVSVMLGRIALLKAAIFVVRAVITSLLKPMHSVSHAIRAKIDDINSQQMVFFTRGDNVAAMNLAMLYVKQNEHTNRIKFVTVVKHKDEVPERLRREIDFLDEAYPSIDIEFVVLEGTFGPELIQQLSQQWKIPTNFMFIGSPGDHFVYGLAELGGVRLII